MAEEEEGRTTEPPPVEKPRRWRRLLLVLALTTALGAAGVGGYFLRVAVEDDPSEGDAVEGVVAEVTPPSDAEVVWCGTNQGWVVHAAWSLGLLPDEFILEHRGDLQSFWLLISISTTIGEPVAVLDLYLPGSVLDLYNAGSVTYLAWVRDELGVDIAGDDEAGTPSGSFSGDEVAPELEQACRAAFAAYHGLPSDALTAP